AYAAQTQQQTADKQTQDQASPQEPVPQSKEEQNPSAPPQENAPGAAGKLMVTVGKSLIIDSPVNIKRVHVANGALAEAVAVNPKEVLINGTAPGETSLIVWQANDNRLVYDLTVRLSGNKLDAIRQQIARDFPTEDISLTFES